MVKPLYLPHTTTDYTVSTSVKSTPQVEENRLLIRLTVAGYGLTGKPETGFGNRVMALENLRRVPHDDKNARLNVIDIYVHDLEEMPFVQKMREQVIVWRFIAVFSLLALIYVSILYGGL